MEYNYLNNKKKNKQLRITNSVLKIFNYIIKMKDKLHKIK